MAAWSTAGGLVMASGNRTLAESGGTSGSKRNSTATSNTTSVQEQKADSRIVNLRDKSLGLSAYSDFSPSTFLGAIPAERRPQPLVGYGEAIPVPLPHSTHHPDTAASTSNNPVVVQHLQPDQYKPTPEASYFHQALPAGFHQPQHHQQQEIRFHYQQALADPGFAFPEHGEDDSGIESQGVDHQEPPAYTVELEQHHQPQVHEESPATVKEPQHHQLVYDFKPDKFEHDYSVTDFNSAPGYDYSTTSLDAQTTTSYNNPSLPTVDLDKFMADSHKKLAWKSVLKVLAALVPLGLFVAALHPNVLVVNATDSGYPKPTGQSYKSEAALKSIEPTILSEDCMRRRLCDVLALALKSESINGTYEAIKSRSPQVGDGMLEEVLGAAKVDRCADFPCRHQSSLSSWTFS